MEPFKYDARIYGKYLKLERVVRNHPRERLRRGGQLGQDPPVTGVRVRRLKPPFVPYPPRPFSLSTSLVVALLLHHCRHRRFSLSSLGFNITHEIHVPHSS
jgi:hypothetical protein